MAIEEQVSCDEIRENIEITIEELGIETIIEELGSEEVIEAVETAAVFILEKNTF